MVPIRPRARVACQVLGEVILVALPSFLAGFRSLVRITVIPLEEARLLL